MFKSGLLISTAMTAVTLLLSGVSTGAETGMHAAPPDANDRFLCTYGGYKVSDFFSGNSGSFHDSWTHVAVPIRGHGKTVSRIVVQEKKSSISADGRFSAGIYSDTASGFPGNLIAGGSATASGHCEKIEIPINPTTLQDQTTYWVMEQAIRRGNRVRRKLYWAVDPTANQKAWVQRHSSSSGFSQTSPWKERTQGPYVRVR